MVKQRVTRRNNIGTFKNFSQFSLPHLTYKHVNINLRYTTIEMVNHSFHTIYNQEIIATFCETFFWFYTAENVDEYMHVDRLYISPLFTFIITSRTQP